MQISPVQRRLRLWCPNFSCLPTDSRRKEGQPLFWSTRPHPPNRAREPRRPSVRLARRGSKEERNKKFPRPRQSFAAYPAQLSSDGRSESESGLSARRRPMGDGRPKFSFRIYAAQSVRLFGYCSPTLCRCARAVLCGNFAPFCNRVSGGKRLPLPLPLRKCWNNPGTHGATLPRSLARSIPLQAEWHRPNMCVRIQFPLIFSSVLVGADGLSLPRGI